MSKTVDYYFSGGSPYCFLAGPRLPALAERTGATFVLKPVEGGPLMAATGGLPVKQRHPTRQAYRLAELRRWKRELAPKMNVEPKYFPVADRLASLTVLAALETGRDALAYVNSIMRTVWEDEGNIADPAVLRGLADAAGFDGAALLATAESGRDIPRLEANTQEAIGRGVFGLPWFVYRDEPFWGQDRLDFLEKALSA